MKYLTKKWLTEEQLSRFGLTVTVSKYADSKSSDNFIRAYNEKEKQFIEIVKTKDGIDVKFCGGDGLHIKNGVVLEGKDGEILAYKHEVPNGVHSCVIAGELHSVKDKIEAHFLINNLDKHNRQQPWYLTVSGDDVREL